MRLMVRSTVILSLVAIGCSSTPGPPPPYPVAWSWSTASNKSVELRFLVPFTTPNCQTDSVTVTGPGLTGPLQLACLESAAPPFFGSVDLGTIGPAPPLAYTFTATLGSTTTVQVATVNCYLDLPAAVAPAPSATVSSPVTLSWTRVPATGIEYRVGPPGLDGKPAYSVIDQASMVVALAPGNYSWLIWAAPVGLYDGSSTLKCGSGWDAGSFTVQ